MLFKNFIGGTKMKLKKKKGFTLIELLIVVAIIAILAAIAIPQFSAYRIRGYNAAADSDLRNMKIALEAFFTDNQVYASTTGCAAPAAGITQQTTAATGPGAGAILTGPVSYTITVAAGTIGTAPGTGVVMLFGLSNNVFAGVTTSGAPAEGQNYAAFTANKSGDSVYAAESGLTSLMRSGKTSAGALVAISLAAPGGSLNAAPTSATQVPATDFGTSFVAM
jgi:type IV pilus assembly protein PilA